MANDRIELKVLRDFYSEPDEEGNQYLEEENIQFLYTFKRSKLDGPLQLRSDKTGKIYKTRCVVIHDTVGNLCVNEPYDKVKDKIYGKEAQIGFIQGKSKRR